MPPSAPALPLQPKGKGKELRYFTSAFPLGPEITEYRAVPKSSWLLALQALGEKMALWVGCWINRTHEVQSANRFTLATHYTFKMYLVEEISSTPPDANLGNTTPSQFTLGHKHRLNLVIRSSCPLFPLLSLPYTPKTSSLSYWLPWICGGEGRSKREKEGRKVLFD